MVGKRFNWLAGSAGILAAWMAFGVSGSSAQTLSLSLLDGPGTPGVDEPVGAARQALALGTPVHVRVALENDTGASIEVLPSVHLGFEFIRLHVTDPSGETRVATTSRWEVFDVFMEPRAVSPGERLTHDAFVFGKLADAGRGGPVEYVFPESGSYELYVSYEYGPLDLESNRVTVDVGAPIAGWQELLESGILPFVEGMTPTSEELGTQREALRGVVERNGIDAFDTWLDAGEEVPTGVLIDSGERSEIEDVVTDFFAAYQVLDFSSCASYLANDFLYNSALDQDEFRQEMLESVANLEGRSLRFEIRDLTMSRTADEEDVKVIVDLDASLGSELDSQRLELVLARRGGEWRIRNWDRKTE